MDAPISRIPVFVKEGTILPVTEQICYADEAEGKALIMKVYAGCDAEFTYYEDSGDGYGYERGECAQTEFIYVEAEKSLYAKERTGSYPGMKELKFETEIIDRKQEQE